MGKSWDLLRDRLNARLSPHGAVSDFCRKSGFSRGGVDKWLGGKQIPRFDQIDAIAEALGVHPWELLRPEGAEPTIQDHDLAECARRVTEAALRAQVPPMLRAAEPADESPNRRRVEALLSTLDDDELSDAIPFLEGLAGVEDGEPVPAPRLTEDPAKPSRRLK